MFVWLNPQFRSIIPCEVLLYIEVTFLDLSIDIGIFWGSWFLHSHEIPHPNQWVSMKNHKEVMFIQGRPQSSSIYLYSKHPILAAFVCPSSFTTFSRKTYVCTQRNKCFSGLLHSHRHASEYSSPVLTGTQQ